MTDTLREQLHTKLWDFFEPDPNEKYLNDLETEILAVLASEIEKAKAAAKAPLIKAYELKVKDLQQETLRNSTLTKQLYQTNEKTIAFIKKLINKKYNELIKQLTAEQKDLQEAQLDKEVTE